jgi:phage tail sheath protein FI
MNYKTPGVFVEEIPLFPPSVAAVATAVPGFVGHTARTNDATGNSLIGKPIRLRSLIEFTQIFGGAYEPASYTVQIDPASDFEILEITPVDGRRYYLFDAVRHYFDNGGGPCYVVTVGDYATDVIYGTDTTGLRGGMRALEKEDEPTILVAPDSVSLSFNDAGNLHKDMIDQCGRLLDRFAVLDMTEGYRAPGHTSAPVQQFRNQVGTENLKYAAVYYPWLNTTYFKPVHFAQLNFVDNQSPPQALSDATIKTITGDTAVDSLASVMLARVADENLLFSKVATVSLNRSNYNPLSAHFDELRGAVSAATTAAVARPAFSKLMSFVREFALVFRDLEDEPTLAAEMGLVLEALKADATLVTQLTALIAFEKNVHVMDSISTTRTVTSVANDYSTLSGEDWIGAATVASIAAETTDFSNGGANSVAQKAQAAAHSPKLQTAFTVIAQAFASLAEDALFRTDRAENDLFQRHPFFKAVLDRVRKDMSMLPPSGAVAGVYAATDRSRGVWKAPANVSLRGVAGPTYKLDDQEQSELNVHSTGKSINAIRAFTGKGILVWGARTLAGNDNEWRYVNVRRFFIFVEESTKKATAPFVFEANDANTWVRVRAMIENFLVIQWRQGALAGSTPKDAFYVKVGLGETMSAQDILEGRMIVEIGMAAVRPAEFIILRFSHKMQES